MFETFFKLALRPPAPQKLSKQHLMKKESQFYLGMFLVYKWMLGEAQNLDLGLHFLISCLYIGTIFIQNTFLCNGNSFFHDLKVLR